MPQNNDSREKTCVVKVITSQEQGSFKETSTEVLPGDLSVLAKEPQSLECCDVLDSVLLKGKPKGLVERRSLSLLNVIRSLLS